MASVNRANSLSQSFIGFLCEPRNISLFLSSIFLSTIFFPYLSLNQSLVPFLLRVSLDPAGAGPRQVSVQEVAKSRIQLSDYTHTHSSKGTRPHVSSALEMVGGGCTTRDIPNVPDCTLKP